MKTITLTSEAYNRLCAWKLSPRDSFSRVVQRVVPARGSLGGVRTAVKRLPALTERQEKTLRSAIEGLNRWSAQRDPWTT